MSQRRKEDTLNRFIADGEELIRQMHELMLQLPELLTKAQKVLLPEDFEKLKARLHNVNQKGKLT
jgi:septation ring formation regulator EzrA